MDLAETDLTRPCPTAHTRAAPSPPRRSAWLRSVSALATVSDGACRRSRCLACRGSRDARFQSRSGRPCVRTPAPGLVFGQAFLRGLGFQRFQPFREGSRSCRSHTQRLRPRLASCATRYSRADQVPLEFTPASGCSFSRSGVCNTMNN